MNRHPKSRQLIVRSAAWCQAFQKLNAALEENTSHSNAEKIRLMRLAMFADVDRLMESGRVVLPKYK